ncbi:RNA-directed DNA polymerase, eukaryota, partial [Tanacetum coccineum]
KRLALGWINEADVGESSVGKNDNVNVDGNVHEEQTINVNDYTIDHRFELDIDENLNLDDYTVYVDENMNENVNVDGNVDENMKVDDEYEQDNIEDEEVIGNDMEDFIMDEEHVINEVEVNMEGFTFSIQEQGAEQTITPNVDLTDKALEVLDFDSFDSDVGDDTASITRRSLRKLRKIDGQSCDLLHTNPQIPIKVVQEHMQKQFQVGVSKTKAFRVKSKAEVHLRGDQEQQYALLKDYCDALKKANQNTTGLLPALKDLFPVAEHKFYVRHIHDNMNLIYKGGHYKELLWKCATATTKVQFERAMDEFKGYNRLPMSGRANCNLLINNSCEVFNKKLLEARDSPVITALEYVRKYLMKRIVIVQKVNEGRQNQDVVNLANRSCTCRKWEVFGIPCKHAVACIFNMNDNGMQVGFLEDWVHQSTRLVDQGHNKRSCKGTSVAGSGSASRAATQPAMESASQPARASTNQPARAKQPQRAASQPASAFTCAPKLTRQTKSKNVAASGSHGVKKTPTRQSQRQKAAKKTPTTM